MILEIADIRIHPGKNADFEAAIARGAGSIIAQAKGFHGYKVNRSMETPERSWGRFSPHHRTWSISNW